MAESCDYNCTGTWPPYTPDNDITGIGVSCEPYDLLTGYSNQLIEFRYLSTMLQQQASLCLWLPFIMSLCMTRQLTLLKRLKKRHPQPAPTQWTISSWKGSDLDLDISWNASSALIRSRPISMSDWNKFWSRYVSSPRHRILLDSVSTIFSRYFLNERFVIPGLSLVNAYNQESAF